MTLEEENKILKERIKILSTELIKLRKEVPTYNSRGAGRKSKIPHIKDKVIDFKRAGFSYSEIAKKTGISKSYVAKIIKGEL